MVEDRDCKALNKYLAVFLLISIPCAGVAPLAHAQSYTPDTIRFVVPFPPGGGTDAIARMIGQKLSEKLNATVLIDNRAGANGIVAAQLTAKAPPNSTIMLVTAGHAINPNLYKALPYDTLRDFVPIARVATGALALVVHPSLPVRSVKELIALAKARPGELNFSSSGTGSPNHLAAEIFNSMAGIRVIHVPYKGAGPALTALLVGEVELTFGTVVSAPPLIKSGRVRGIAVTTEKRVPLLPELPTVAETGLPGFNVQTWFGIVAPAETSTDVVARFNSHIGDVLKERDVQVRFAALGLEALGSTPKEFGELISTEIERWGKVVKAAGIRSN